MKTKEFRITKKFTVLHSKFYEQKFALYDNARRTILALLKNKTKIEFDKDIFITPLDEKGTIYKLVTLKVENINGKKEIYLEAEIEKNPLNEYLAQATGRCVGYRGLFPLNENFINDTDLYLIVTLAYGSFLKEKNR